MDQKKPRISHKAQKQRRHPVTLSAGTKRPCLQSLDPNSPPRKVARGQTSRLIGLQSRNDKFNNAKPVKITKTAVLHALRSSAPQSVNFDAQKEARDLRKLSVDLRPARRSKGNFDTNTNTDTTTGSTTTGSSSVSVNATSGVDNGDEFGGMLPKFIGLPDWHRLIPEDFMTLEAGTGIILIVAKKHQSFSQTFEKVFQALPAPMRFYWKMDTEDCIQLPARVVKNPYLDELSSGMPRQEFDYNLEGNGNAAVMIEFTETLGPVQGIELSWKSVREDCDTLHVYSRMPLRRNWARSFKEWGAHSGAANRRAQQAASLVRELKGDRYSQRDVIAAYEDIERQLGAESSKSDASNDSPDGSHPIASLSEPELMQEMNGVCKEVIVATFSEFTSLSEPILSRDNLRFMADALKDRLPNVYQQFLDILGKAELYNKARNAHLQPRYDRDVLYQFISSRRVRNDHLLPYFGMIIAASNYSATDTSRKVPVSMGMAMHQNRLTEKLKEIAKPTVVLSNTRERVSSLTVAVAALDNIQQGYRLHFQRGGKSSLYVLGTAMMFIKPFLPCGDSLGDFDMEQQSRVQLKYLDQHQHLPSPYQMQRFEDIPKDVAVFPLIMDLVENGCSSIVRRPTTPDFTGDRVSSYQWLLQFAEEFMVIQRVVSSLETYVHQPKAFASSTRQMAVSHLRSMRGGEKAFSCAHRFQATVVASCRGPPKPRAKMMSPPVAPFDETSSEGMLHVQCLFLAITGLILPKRISDPELDPSDLVKLVSSRQVTWALAPNWNERIVLLGVDGLTYKRWIDVSNNSVYTRNPKLSYAEAYDQEQVFSKALSRVVLVAGGLHKRMQMKDMIFNYFYGVLLQPIQTALGWKRIKGSDVTVCFQQASNLIELVLEECERILYDVVIHKRINQERWRKWQQLFATQQMGPEDLSQHLAIEFWKYLDYLQTESTDQRLKVIANFVVCARLDRSFELAGRCDDSTTQEAIWSKLLPLYYVAGKKNYFAIDVHSMEELYSRLPPQLLEILRWNRHIVLYNKNDPNGKAMAERELDDVMEWLNGKHKSMGFSNNQESWYNQSPWTPLVSRCQSFVQQEFTEYQDVEMYDSWSRGDLQNDGLDLMRTARRKTVKSRRTEERQCVTEFLVGMGIHEEVAGKEIPPDGLWYILKGLKTVFSKPNSSGILPEEGGDSSNTNNFSATPAAVGSLDQTKEGDPRANPVTNSGDGDGADDDSDMLWVTAKARNEEPEDDGDEDDGDEDGQLLSSHPEKVSTTKATSEGRSYYTGVVCGHKVRVRMAAMNEASWTNFFTKGRQKLQALDLPGVKLREKRRAERSKRVLHNDLYESLRGKSTVKRLKATTGELNECNKAFLETFD